MTVSDSHLPFVEHIVEWGEKIPTLIGNRSYDQFVSDVAVHLAVWKCIEVVGEAAGRILQLAPDLVNRHPALPLKQAYGMRNRLTHGYKEIDLFILWNTARDFVPVMVSEARALLDSAARP
jgi:uncharacterized protein with HEPN domain